MTQDDKQLLLKDLCARLPYGVKIDTPDGVDTLGNVDINEGWINVSYDVDEVKPYLRPMSSMTEEERDFVNNEFFKNSDNFQIDDVGEMYTESQPFESIYTLSLKIQSKYLDWLNAHYFDYRGLIEKNLAIKVTKENNPYK